MPSAELLNDPAGRRLEAATAVARALGGETELDRTLALIADRGRTLIDADGLLILLREDGGLVVAAGAGDVPDDVCGSRVAGSPDRIRDALGLASGGGMLVPLIFRGQSVGMLVAFGTRGDLALLQAFAASAATAVATARRVEEQRLRDALHAADEERSRWARELHDDTLQGLGGLRMLLTAAARSSDPAQLRSAVEGAVERIEEEIDGLRGLIRELRPAALDQLGLAAAIEGLATRTAERQGIVVEVTVAAARRPLRARRSRPRSTGSSKRRSATRSGIPAPRASRSPSASAAASCTPACTTTAAASRRRFRPARHSSALPATTPPTATSPTTSTRSARARTRHGRPLRDRPRDARHRGLRRPPRRARALARDRFRDVARARGHDGQDLDNALRVAALVCKRSPLCSAEIRDPAARAGLAGAERLRERPLTGTGFDGDGNPVRVRWTRPSSRSRLLPRQAWPRAHTGRAAGRGARAARRRPGTAAAPGGAERRPVRLGRAGQR